MRCNIVYCDLLPADVHTDSLVYNTFAFSREPLPGFDVYAYLNVTSFKKRVEGKYNVLILEEPSVVLPQQYDPRVWQWFDHIFTAHDYLSDMYPDKFTYIYTWRGADNVTITEDLAERQSRYPLYGRKNAIVMVAGNKSSPVPSQIYSMRAEAATWWHEHSSMDFKVFGTPAFDLPNYEGAVAPGPLPRLRKFAEYRYTFCTENTNHDLFSKGYHQKIPDCLEARTVPIYYGCANIEKYVPKSCFIDFRDYGSYEAVDTYIRGLTEDDYLAYVAAIDDFVCSGGLRPWSLQTTYKEIAHWYDLAIQRPKGVSMESTNKTVCIVFSKDRAMQLDGCLRSLYRHCDDVDRMDVKVIWTISNTRAYGQYRMLSNAAWLTDTSDFIEETDFQADLLAAINGYKYVMFVTDDTMFVQDFTVSGAVLALKRSCTLGVSLRLGRNAVYCYMQNKEQRVPTGNISPWLGGEGDFGYPFDLSSSIYRIADLMPLLEQPAYNSPNTLEAFLDWSKGQFENKPYLWYYDESVAFANPLNKVQTTFTGNRSGSDPRFSAEHLADLYDKGYRIDVSEFDGFVPDGVHQEVDLEFVGPVGEPYKEEKPIEVSILMVNYDGGENVKKALQSVERTIGDHSCQIIVWDNNSTDGSKDFLRKAAEIFVENPFSLIQMTVIESDENIGMAARAELIPLAKGQYIVICDNDIIFTDGWLDKCLAWASVIPNLGIIGPRTSYASGPQMIDVPVTYGDEIEDIEAFSKAWSDGFFTETELPRKGQLWQTPRLVGFFLFITPACIEKIGNIRRFGKFGFEDEDYTIRASLAGLLVLIDNGLYIHHTGGPQGQGNTEYNRLMMEAWDKFKVVWGLPPDLKYGATNHIDTIMRTTAFDEERHYLPIEGE